MGDQPFIKKKHLNSFSLKNAKFVDKYGLYLPNHANLSLNDINYVTKKIFKYRNTNTP